MSAKTSASVSFFHSSFFRATLLVAASVLAVVVSMTLYNVHTTSELALKQLQQQAQGASGIIAKQLVGPMRFSDKLQLGKALQDVVDDPSNPADMMMAVNEKGEALATYAAEGADTAELTAMAQTLAGQKSVVTSEDGLTIATPVTSATSGTVLGYVLSHWSEEQTDAAIASATRTSLIVSGLILIAAMLLTSFFFRAMISLRLGRINTAMSAIADGALATEVPYTGTKDEIGHIAKSLEAFRQSLEQAEATNRVALMRGTALASASTAIMLTDTAHVITWANEAMVKLMRVHAAAIRARNPDFDPDNMIGYRADRIVEGGTEIAGEMDAGTRASLRIEQDLASGTLVVEANPVMTPDGTKIGHVAEWHDITEARRNIAITEAIDATQLRVEFTPDGRMSAANVAMCVISQRDESQLIGMDFSRLVRVAATGEMAFEAIARGENVIGRLLLSIDGQELLLNGAMTPVRDRKGTIRRVVAIGTDMSEIESREAHARIERERAAAEQRQVVDQLRDALRHLAEGDLTQAIREPFPGDYETLRVDYNDATAKLREAMAMVLENSSLIRTESGSISRAAEDLSRRTEQQAATLEETAAALNELTASVKSAADRTLKANDMVALARRNTESSGQVVREAVQAMGEISESSNKISRITSVIEEISFQTNLLALNAGVEAARAGEAGRGFAVVASEVRALAQRSSEAAREIAGLISDSAGQVKRGVELVGQAGSALDGIQGSVAEIVTFMSDITASTTEQSAGLSEVNTAILQLDQVTQHNAAMFEETSAASQSLAREADGLNDTMSRFRLGTQQGTGAAASNFRSTRPVAAPVAPAPAAEPKAPTPIRAATPAPAPAPAPASAPAQRASARASNLAVKQAPAEDNWEDF
ncbi:methyl-accepting chemotaxis protein [Rhodobacter capsulatus]|uniref:methyl-accepting chemotaxis protein n=1 Tax=Rhodobacter capsulatus TaxID=1061 RepID=UPI0003D35D25|nr:methyl-accepting chemotaxis protein [Rhodobacter capsulatus]ETD90437.1 methyl-accepting chemotaxis protein [Rhodobacter capsulatus YW2]